MMTSCDVENNGVRGSFFLHDPKYNVKRILHFYTFVQVIAYMHMYIILCPCACSVCISCMCAYIHVVTLMQLYFVSFLHVATFMMYNIVFVYHIMHNCFYSPHIASVCTMSAYTHINTLCNFNACHSSM